MSESHPRISIIAVDGSFRERFHLLDSLAEYPDLSEEFELLWVEHYEKVKPELAERIDRHPSFRLITLDRTDSYHSSRCFNAGIEAARAEVLVILDADVVVEKGFIEAVLKAHESNEKLVMYVYRYDEREEDHQSQLDIDHLRQVCVLKNATNYGGCLTVRKKWLQKINGYELHPIFGGGFHANGLDVYTRLKNLGMHVMWHPTLRLLHPWHPGTAFHSDAYTAQKAIIRFRELGLAHLPFNGIDSAHDAEMPADLAKRCDSIQQGTGKDVRGWYRRLRKLVG